MDVYIEPGSDHRDGEEYMIDFKGQGRLLV